MGNEHNIGIDDVFLIGIIKAPADSVTAGIREAFALTANNVFATERAVEFQLIWIAV
jgi:hypothetical protein